MPIFVQVFIWILSFIICDRDLRCGTDYMYAFRIFDFFTESILQRQPLRIFKRSERTADCWMWKGFQVKFNASSFGSTSLSELRIWAIYFTRKQINLNRIRSSGNQIPRYQCYACPVCKVISGANYFVIVYILNLIMLIADTLRCIKKILSALQAVLSVFDNLFDFQVCKNMLSCTWSSFILSLMCILSAKQ